MCTASSTESAKLPNPEPNIIPTFGGLVICVRMDWATLSICARVKNSLSCVSKVILQYRSIWLLANEMGSEAADYS
jgi:hypothetical protein